MSASEMKLNLAKPGIDAEADAYRASRRRSLWRSRSLPALGIPGIVAAWWAVVAIFDVKPFIAPHRAWCCKRCTTSATSCCRTSCRPRSRPPGIPARQSAGGAAGDGVRAQQDVAGDFLSGRRHDQFDPDRRQGADPGADHGQRHRAQDHDRRHGVLLPTLVNMVRGLEDVNPQSLELMRVLSASKREIFFKLRLYNSLPSSRRCASPPPCR